MTLVVATAASGVARTAHFTLPTGASAPIQTLLLEPQRTNRVLQSQTLADAAWVATNVTVTANNATAPDGTATADTLDATVNGGTLIQSSITFGVGFTDCSISVFLKVGTAAATDIELYDSTAATSRRVVRATWTAGVPAVTSVSGTGTIYTTTEMANGWYRVMFGVTSITGANSHQLRILPASASTGTVIVWGVQGEPRPVPSRYIVTTGTVATRNADILYFPYTAVPQELTIYCRGIDLGTYALTTNPSYWYIGDAAGSTTVAHMQLRVTSTTGLRADVHNGTTGVNGLVNITAGVLGQLREFRVVLAATGAITCAGAVNGGTETVGTASAANTLPAAWADTRLYLNVRGAVGEGSQGLFGYTHFIIAAGTQTMATMRQLAGVA